MQELRSASNGIFNNTTAQEYGHILQDVEAKQAALLLSTQGLTNAQIAETLAVNESSVSKNYQAMADAGLLKNKQSLTLAQIQENLQTVLGTEADTSAAMSALGLSAAIEGQEHQTVQITAKKLQEAIVTGALTEAQAQELAMRTGVTASINAQTASGLPKWIASMKAATAAVWAQVKAQAALMLHNPMTWIMGGIAVIGILKSAYNHFQKQQEEARKSAEEAANTYKETSSSVLDYASRYEELHRALLAARGDEEETYHIRRQLLELQTEINDKYGEEYGNLNLLTDAYKDHTKAIIDLNREAAQALLNDNQKGMKDAAKKMTKENHYNLSELGIASASEEGAALREIAEKYQNQGVEILETLDGGSFSVHLNADPESAYRTINAFMSEVRAKANELGDEHLFEDILDISHNALKDAREIIEKYGEIYSQSLIAEIASDDEKSNLYNQALEYVEAYQDAVSRSEDPYNDAGVENTRQNLKALQDIIENDEDWKKYANLMNDVFDQADTRILDFNDALRSDSELQKLVEDLRGMDDLELRALNENAGDHESFDRLKEAANVYHIAADELIDDLVRLGIVQGTVSSKPLTFDLSSCQKTIDNVRSSVSAAELADMYPEILTNAEVSTNGQISLQVSQKQSA